MYLRTQPSPRVVRQEFETSCGAACARQVLLDAGIDVPESRIRELVGFNPDLGLGITLEALARVLDQLHPGARYKSGSVPHEELPALAHVTPFIALLKTPAKHIVIVDEIAEAEVRVRDPAGIPGGPPVGLEGVMDRQVFVNRWTRAFNGVVLRCA